MTTDITVWARGLKPVGGHTIVVAVEGRSGAGKTTLARRLASDLEAPLVRLDHLYLGWDGLLGGVTALGDWVLRPVAEGQPARWRRWDWHAGEYAEWHDVTPGPYLVIEGVGSGAAGLRAYRSGLIWVEAPEALRRQRAMARDGELYRPFWERWARQEDDFYARNQVREQADLIIENHQDEEPLQSDKP